MVTIAILGANSQVGSEVALLLSKFPGIRVLPVARTPLASFFIRRCGLDCEHGNVEDFAEASKLLRDADVVADFAIARGMPSETRAITTRRIASVMAAAPAKAKYVFISSMTAFGMPKGDGVPLRGYLLSHTMYGASKRHGERLTWKLGQRSRRSVYSLRLGQVHGELQGISRLLLDSAGLNRPTTVPTGASYTVFAFTIAEALSNIARDREEPGVYTMVSNPSWTWQEVYEYYASQAGVVPDLTLDPAITVPSMGAALAGTFARRGRALIRELSLRHAEMVAGNVVVHFPALERRLLGRYMQESRAPLLRGAGGERYRPFDGSWRGVIPGPFLNSLSDSRVSMAEAVRELRATLHRASQVPGSLPDDAGRLLQNAFIA